MKEHVAFVLLLLSGYGSEAAAEQGDCRKYEAGFSFEHPKKGFVQTGNVLMKNGGFDVFEGRGCVCSVGSKDIDKEPTTVRCVRGRRLQAPSK